MTVAEARAAHAMPFGAEVRSGGVRFRLWAPSREQVTVVADGLPYVMEARGGGWFECVVDGARAGTRYAFVFPRDDLQVPDPASRRQPDGPHGASEVVDPRAYVWRAAGWRGRPWRESVISELHVGTFTPEGTYAAAAARLPALAELGITSVELMPLAQPAGDRNWGYDGVLPFAPARRYGTPDDLKRFIDEAHGLGMNVLLDVVFNHFGPDGNYLAAYARPFFTTRHHTPWGAAIDLEGEHAETVREFFIQNALYWLREFRFDGLRLDAVHEIRDASPRPFLEELAARVRAECTGREVHLVLENDANEARLLDRYDAQWDDDAHHALHVLLTGEHTGYYRDYAGEPGRLLARALTEGFAYQGEPSAHRNGAPRGEPSAMLPSTSFVTFLQNHDQIGNRAHGERIGALAPPEAVRAAHTLLLVAPPIPMLFMGEEWAASSPFQFFTDFGPELGAAVYEGRRREFALDVIPDPQDPATFAASVLRWNERGDPPHGASLEYVRALLAVRAAEIVPRLGDTVRGDGYACSGRATFSARWRLADGARLACAANLQSKAAPLPLLPGALIARCGEPGGPWSVTWTLAP